MSWSTITYLSNRIAGDAGMHVGDEPSRCVHRATAKAGKRVGPRFQSRVETRFRYVIMSPDFKDTNGGAIALHYLCHLLNTAGIDASLAALPWPRPPEHPNPLRSAFRAAKYGVRSRLATRLKLHPDLRTPINRRPVDAKTVVVYPEIVDGNPLGGRHVVRWFLHRPGFITGRANYGDDELRFFYQAAFDDQTGDPHGTNLLSVRWYRRDVYRQWNDGTRAGTCFLLRKGRGRVDPRELPPEHILDGLPHDEMADAFNRYEYLVCYDPYTMYTRYAAMCGCIPIVVPVDGVRLDVWHPEVELRYGIAYGFDDVEWARATRPDLLRTIDADEVQQLELVDRFVDTTRSHFASCP